MSGRKIKYYGNTQGVTIKRGAVRDDFNSLPASLYIIRQEDKTTPLTV